MLFDVESRIRYLQAAREYERDPARLEHIDRELRIWYRWQVHHRRMKKRKCHL